MVSRALWWDGIFELALGSVLAFAPLTGMMRALTLPPPASPAVVFGFGIALLPVGLWLLMLSRRWTAGIVTALGIVNAAGALFLGCWLARAWIGFSPSGRQLTAGVAVALALLAAAELGGLMLGRSRPPAG
jgi:hypothetical protein